MINPYEAPQSKLDADEATPRVITEPAWALIIGISSLALIPLGILFYAAIPDFYAIYFDQSLIPKDARAPGYLGNYVALPLIALWIFAQLRFLFSRGKRAGKGLAIVYCAFAGMMLFAVCEGMAAWMGITKQRPDLPPRTENDLSWFFIIFSGLLVFFSVLAYGHWRVQRFYRGLTPPT